MVPAGYTMDQSLEASWSLRWRMDIKLGGNTNNFIMQEIFLSQYSYIEFLTVVQLFPLPERSVLFPVPLTGAIVA